jgi:hypothetical protein
MFERRSSHDIAVTSLASVPVLLTVSSLASTLWWNAHRPTLSDGGVIFDGVRSSTSGERLASYASLDRVVVGQGTYFLLVAGLILLAAGRPPSRVARNVMCAAIAAAVGQCAIGLVTMLNAVFIGADGYVLADKFVRLGPVVATVIVAFVSLARAQDSVVPEDEPTFAVPEDEQDHPM